MIGGPYYIVETDGYMGHTDGANDFLEWEIHVVGPFGIHYLNEVIEARLDPDGTQRNHLRARARSICAILNAEAEAA